MRRLGCAVSFLALATVFALNAAAQQPGSAGAKRPNLRVLQALPESQLFPLMNLISESLGVRCDYCHVQVAPDFSKTPSNVGGWVWDRDDKPQKRVAREMMQMVMDLNAGRFDGETRITCYTCHRGSTQPARTVPLPPASLGARTTSAAPLPSADRVWTSYVDAVGGVEPHARDAGTVYSGWDDRSEGRYARVEIVVAGDDRYRLTVTMPDGTTSSQGLDGEFGWVASKDRVQRLEGADLARLRQVAMRYRRLRDRPADLRVVGLERIADRDVYVATSTPDATTTRTFYFDAVTGLLRREMTTSDTVLLPLQEQVDYDDYRDVDGVQLPFRVQTSDGAPYGNSTRTFLQIRRNVPVSQALFQVPAGSS